MREPRNLLSRYWHVAPLFLFFFPFFFAPGQCWDFFSPIFEFEFFFDFAQVQSGTCPGARVWIYSFDWISNRSPRAIVLCVLKILISFGKNFIHHALSFSRYFYFNLEFLTLGVYTYSRLGFFGREKRKKKKREIWNRTISRFSFNYETEIAINDARPRAKWKLILFSFFLFQVSFKIPRSSVSRFTWVIVEILFCSDENFERSQNIM